MTYDLIKILSASQVLASELHVFRNVIYLKSRLVDLLYYYNGLIGLWIVNL